MLNSSKPRQVLRMCSQARSAHPLIVLAGCELEYLSDLLRLGAGGRPALVDPVEQGPRGLTGIELLPVDASRNLEERLAPLACVGVEQPLCPVQAAPREPGDRRDLLGVQ